jgi:hypothetical protein
MLGLARERRRSGREESGPRRSGQGEIDRPEGHRAEGAGATFARAERSAYFVSSIYAR